MAKYDFYTKRSVSAPAQFINGNFRKKLWAMAQSCIPSKAKVCEFGPGQGQIAKIITEHGHDYVCYEESAANAAYLKEQGLTVINHRVPPIDEPDESCDVVIASHVLEHMTGPTEIEIVLTEVHRVLKPNGYFLIATPNVIETKEFFFDSDWTHQYPTSPFRLKRLFEDSGYTLKKDCHIYLGYKGYLGRLLRFPFIVLFGLGMATLPDSVRFSETMSRIRVFLMANHCSLFQKK